MSLNLPLRSTRAAVPLAVWPKLSKAWRPVIVLSALGIVGILIAGFVVKWNTSELKFLVQLNDLNTPWLNTVGIIATKGVAPAPAILIGIVFAGLVAWRFRSAAIGLGAGAALALSWISSDAIKLLVHRARPDWMAINHHLVSLDLDPSFPSGHVTFVASLAVVLGLLLRQTKYRWWAWIVGIVATCFVALGRMYVGAHYPSDVIAGALYGIFGGIIAFAFVGWLLEKTPIGTRVNAVAGRIFNK